MRRPLKPFIKEYRTSGRRPPSGSDSPSQSEQPSDLFGKLRPGAGAPDADDSYEAALRAADALFRQDEDPPAAASEPEAPGFAEDPPAPQSGRILRVIDEAPLQQFAELEALHAPKRRGRKPGSKNKPKPEHEVIASAPIELALSAAAVAASPRPVPRVAQVKIGRADRFSWVRDRLRPGEEWKRRRLPRICW
jgi:hypothetical protein